jgi:histidinol-phosphatase (PHP family)
VLPPDSHVHSEWSYDAAAGSMYGACERAVELGLPSIAFTEHSDFTRWTVSAETIADLSDELRRLVDASGVLVPPGIDVDGYLECVQRCRDRFPGLRVLSGLEIGEPHWHTERVAELLTSAPFDRVLGSLHSIRVRDQALMIEDMYLGRPAEEVLREYLAEAVRMIETSDPFEVLTHIDYPIRSWPRSAPAYHPKLFEEEYRAVLQALARSGRVLEVNTVLPLHPQVVRWWYEVGGGAVSFGSDAHQPVVVAHGFAEAVAMVEAQGFKPGRDPYDFWRRTAR